MATKEDLQKRLDDKSFDPSKLNRKQRQIIDELIRRGELKGPTTDEIIRQRGVAAEAIARRDEFYADPIGEALEAEDSFFKGRPTAELAGDLSGSIAPYVAMRKKIYGAAVSGNLWQKGPGKFLQSAIKVADRLPGRFKLLGGALKLAARAADVPSKVLASPAGRAELYSVLGGTVGAGTGSITYDMLNEQIGVNIASAITDEFRDLPDREIDQDILANAARATKDAAMFNAGAAALTPFLFGPLGKLTAKLFGAKSDKAARLAEYTRDKGLPLPLMTGIEDGVFSDLGRNYFKTVGVFPFVSGIGREALQVAEQEAGKQYLDGLVRYAPLMHTSALSSSIFNQASKVFKENAALIGAQYQAFERFAKEAGNPRLISLDKTAAYVKELADANKAMFPDIPNFKPGIGDIDVKAIDKYLKEDGDPLNLAVKMLNAIGDSKITPLEYSGVMKMVNKAITDTQKELPVGSVWQIRQYLEHDLNAFGEKLGKGFLKGDEVISKTYDDIVESSGKELAEADLAYKYSMGTQLYDKLKKANAVFSATMGFYQKGSVPKILKRFDSNLFTQKGVNGVLGKEALPRDQVFEVISRNVFASNSPEALIAFKKMIGAEGKNATANGKLLYEATKANYLANTFLSAFKTADSPRANSIFTELGKDVAFKSQNKYFTEAVEEIGTDRLLAERGFSIEDVKLGNGVFDVSKIRFSPKDFASFDINKFMTDLGIGKATEANGRKKMAEMLGKGNVEEFYKFTDYMKAISDISISDTSTFLQRRFTLSGGRGVLSGVVIGGGMAAVNPFAPAIFLLLARKAGRILTDPVSLRYLNDALGADEMLKMVKGEKILGQRVGRSYNAKPLTALGLTQKREAFARLINYFADEDEDTPRVNPKTVDPVRIQEELLGMPFEVPKPKFDENTIPKETLESMFAQDFTGSSGNVETDNQMVDYVRATARAESETDADDINRDLEADEERITDDIQLQNPVAQTPTTGQQVDPQQFSSLFPNDAVGAAIAQRRQRGQG